jgi:alpha-tubulin suppressor-like RCC1 family protein
VVAVGYNDFGQCDVSGWTNIVAIAAGEYHTVGLRKDGKLLAVGRNDDDQCHVDHLPLIL